MNEIVELLERTDKIYDAKLNEGIDNLEAMSVSDERFKPLLDTVSALISLKIEKVAITAKEKMKEQHDEEQRKINESMKKGGK